MYPKCPDIYLTDKWEPQLGNRFTCNLLRVHCVIQNEIRFRFTRSILFFNFCALIKCLFYITDLRYFERWCFKNKIANLMSCVIKNQRRSLVSIGVPLLTPWYYSPCRSLAAHWWGFLNRVEINYIWGRVMGYKSTDVNMLD
jgi:hypothetical protein